MEERKQPLLLIVAAFAPELAPFKDLLSNGQKILGLDCPVHCQEVGVGLVDSGIGMTRTLLNYDSSKYVVHVIFVGSVGALDPSIPPGTLVLASQVELLDASLVKGETYLPPPMSRMIRANSDRAHIIADRLSSLRANVILNAELYSPLGITRHQEVAQVLSKSCMQKFENLELFAIASACQSFDMPWTALCPVTNTVGPEGQEQWRANHEKAALLAAQHLFQGTTP